MGMEQFSDLESMAAFLDSNEDFRVLKRVTLPYETHPQINARREQKGNLFGIYLDTETTGLDWTDDKITSLSMLPFVYNKNRFVSFAPPITLWNDPGRPISPEITELTGITNEMVAGKSLPVMKLRETLGNATLVIAHHAEFDRKFVESALTLPHEDHAFGSHIKWACSLQDVPWDEIKPMSKKLEAIALSLGGFYDAHRSENDCIAGCFVLNHTMPNGRTGFEHVIEAINMPRYRIENKSLPFAVKDMFKEAGYSWRNEDKVWWKEFTSLDELKQEKNRLVSGYSRPIERLQGLVSINLVNANDRWSTRKGQILNISDVFEDKPVNQPSPF